MLLLLLLQTLIVKVYAETELNSDPLTTTVGPSIEENWSIDEEEYEIKSNARVHPRPRPQVTNPVDYIYSSDDCSYFISKSQRQTNASSNLLRICHGIDNYFSYTEIPITCRVERKNHDIVQLNNIQATFIGKPGIALADSLGLTIEDDILFTVFSEKNFSSTYKSAICIYWDLDRVFSERLLTAKSVFEHKESLMTIATTVTGKNTVIIAGTDHGHLMKISVSSLNTSKPILHTVIEEGSPINILFDSKFLHFYVLSDKKITRLQTHECGLFDTCHSCIESKVPYCGWCSQNNRCSTNQDCKDETSGSSLNWTKRSTDKCLAMAQVKPDHLQISTPRTLQLVIQNASTVVGELFCGFSFINHTTLYTNATKTSEGISCPTPYPDDIPHIPVGQNDMTAKLFIHSAGGYNSVPANFRFFDCSTYKTCTQCVSSSFPCDWCIDGQRCTHDTAQNCRNDILVIGVNNEGARYRIGPSFCPAIVGYDLSGHNEILIPAGVKKTLRIKVHILGQFIAQTRFICQFNIEGRMTQVNAQLLADIIFCEGMEFDYTSKAPNITGSISVLWDLKNPLDNPSNVHLLIYRCSDMANDVEACRLKTRIHNKYNCVWCQKSNSCEVEEKCTS